MFTSVGWGGVIRWRDCVLTVILVEVDQHNTYPTLTCRCTQPIQSRYPSGVTTPNAPSMLDAGISAVVPSALLTGARIHGTPHVTLLPVAGWSPSPARFRRRGATRLGD
jgi:hypothetical protein